ncbi:MAG: SCO family protein, partial [Proteobacteria bacterium]|nr:SCO family protein [Pseudomonadota bacterium]
KKPLKPAHKKSRTRWGADYFPNVPLINQDGKTVRFFDDLLKDKVVMINFIYTNCPDVCSVETARLLNVQNILGDRVGKDIFMYSITIDPDHDTPEVLKKYKEKYDVGPGWNFFTGKEDDILLLREKLGLYAEGLDAKGPSTDHNVSLVIGNQRTGKWMKRSPFDDPNFLATQVGSWLTNWRRPEDANSNTYANAPKLRNTTMGENVFRTRCSSCHSIGVRNFKSDGKRRLGPDLHGVVAKRERAWLHRWIAEPNKMLAEKDPLAMEIFEQYNKMPMPNLRLSKTEVDAVIEYMIEEDRLANEQQKATLRIKDVKPPVPKPIDGRFELVDSAGRTVTDASFRGKWMLVFFGYTFCPEVCPTTLNNIAETMNLLGPEARDVRPIFILVDPKRDLPSNLADYTAAFDQRIVGLTGSPSQVAAAAKSYNVFYQKIGKTEDYTMDHSAKVYLIGPDGRYVAQFSHKAGSEQMAARLKNILADSGRASRNSRAAKAQ